MAKKVRYRFKHKDDAEDFAEIIVEMGWAKDTVQTFEEVSLTILPEAFEDGDNMIDIFAKDSDGKLLKGKSAMKLADRHRLANKMIRMACRVCGGDDAPCLRCKARLELGTTPPDAVCKEVKVARRRSGAQVGVTAVKGKVKISYDFAKSIGEIRKVTKLWKDSVKSRLDESTMSSVLKDWKDGGVDLLIGN